ncbi:MAG: glycoside hydrolase, partial [bacterium]
ARSADGGHSWKTISPDLTLRPGEKEADAKGVIYTIAPSPVAAGTIWIGTDNGLVQLTRDEGKTWNEVSPKGLAPWSMISLIDASSHDPATAYAAVDRHQMDDIKPYIYRTRDFGKTWTQITNGIPDNTYVHAVREDPVRKGLLFAGTETGVFVSFNDGENWQPLQLNLPSASVRDLVIKGNDLVIATHGRSFWILDDISPLREMNAQVANASVHLFQPASAIRIRKNEGHDTPLPPETPAGKNPPTGAIIDYSLKSVPVGEVTLEILDARGALVRKYSNNDQQRPLDESQPFPTYWFRPPFPLAKKVGLNRFVWDLRYDRPPALRYGYSIGTAFGEDATMVPEGPLVLPGTYQVKLTVDGRNYTAPIEVKMDPRVKVAPLALNQQAEVEKRIIAAMNQSFAAVQQIVGLREQLAKVLSQTKPGTADATLAEAAKALDKKAAELVAVEEQYPPVGIISAASINGAFGSLLRLIESADAAPTAQANETFITYKRLLDQQLAKWEELKRKDLPALNVMLQQKQMPPIEISDK